MHEPALAQHDAVAAYSRKQIIEMTRKAHEVSTKLLNEIAECLEPGITEADARKTAEDVFACYRIDKNWHRPYIYFGLHTILTAYDEKPKDDILTLGEEDIAYIDIGPVVRTGGVDVEGDVGKTYVFGNNPLHHKLKRTTEEVFDAAREFWDKNQPSGIELYEYIHRLTEQAGFVFQLQPAGHLIGSFPHLGWKQGLNTYPHTPEPGIWILEVQMRHPSEPVGAFYEAVLL